MTSLQDEYQIRRSTDPAMMSFTVLRLPIPDQEIYATAAKIYARADFSRVGDGYPSLTWVWDVLSWGNLATLLDLLDGAEYTDVRVRCETRDGTYPNAIASFKTFTAVMLKPIMSGTDGVPIARSSNAYQTVTLRFRKLVAV